MQDNNVAVLGVLHPGVTDYIQEYLKSLERQTYQKFDLILFDDGFNEIQLIESNSLNIIIKKTQGSPSDIRLSLINYVLEKEYEFIIFTDCDDFFSSNRIEISVSTLSKQEIAVNDLDLVSERGEIRQKNYLSKRLQNGQCIKINDLLHSNMMGLTNTAVRKEVLIECLPVLHSEVIAFDWLLWSSALDANDNEAMFTSETSTQYRIHQDNIAGFPELIDEKILRDGIEIKLSHYKNLANLGSVYENLYNSFALAKKMSQNSTWLGEYIVALNENRMKNPLWWENIKTPEEVGIL